MPNYAFNAKELDEENNMYYYSARYYAPPTFISRDPLMDEKPWLTPYHYCSNNPVNKVDPTGMLDEDPPDFLLLLSKALGIATTNPIFLIPRAPITKALGRSHAFATNLPEVLAASMAQCESVELKGQLIDKIKNDPDMKKQEAAFIDKMKTSAKFIKNGKYSGRFNVQFGGSRGNGDGGWTAKGAASAAGNELTWIIRNTTVLANATRNNDGTVTINYSLSPDEKLDLRPNGSEKSYDAITRVLGYYYHDKLGGNDQMQVKATWSTTIKLE